MRKAVALGLLGLGAASLASAKGNFPMAGCGLGYIAFGHQQNTQVQQVLSATVNDIVSPKTFAITSGTSGCTEDGAVKLAYQAQVYAELNLVSLRREIAAGDGEFVRAFAAILGGGSERAPAIVEFLHRRYAALFPAADTSSSQLMENLRLELANHPEVMG